MSKVFTIPKKIVSEARDLPIIEKAVRPSPQKAFTVVKAVAFDKVKQFLIPNTGTPEDAVIGKSFLGTPVYTRVTLKREFDTTIGNDIAGDGYIKFDNAILTVTQAKNIIKTPIQGRNGTVKEYISDADYTIVIRCQITSNYAYKFPQEELDYLTDLLTLQNEIVIDSDFLNLFGISYAVVESYDFGQIEGSRGRVDFTCTLVSDQPIELELGITDNA